MALLYRNGRFMSRSLRKMAVGIVFLLPLLLLAACSGVSGPTPKMATAIGKTEAPLEVGPATGNAGRVALDAARSMLGVAYRYGGTDSRGFDCSGLVQYSYAKAGLKLPRTSQDIFRASELVNPGNLQAGDLVFFNTMRRAFSHVGIYVGEGQFLHAPASGGEVRIEEIGKSYWTKRFNGARRLVQDTEDILPAAK